MSIKRLKYFLLDFFIFIKVLLKSDELFSDDIFTADFNAALIGILNKLINRSNRRRCSMKKGVLQNFAKFTGKHLCQSLFLLKL